MTYTPRGLLVDYSITNANKLLHTICFTKNCSSKYAHVGIHNIHVQILHFNVSLTVKINTVTYRTPERKTNLLVLRSIKSGAKVTVPI